jgi:DNA mismatch repair protein MutS2
MFNDIYSIDNLPTLDLHGEIGDFARIKVNDYINENFKLKNKYIVIIHGKGTGVVKKATYEALKSNKLVEDYKLYYFNDGCTIVKLK